MARSRRLEDLSIFFLCQTKIYPIINVAAVPIMQTKTHANRTLSRYRDYLDPKTPFYKTDAPEGHERQRDNKVRVFVNNVAHRRRHRVPRGRRTSPT